jgi:IclR family transcriptional regulator, acetate operon repressor
MAGVADRSPVESRPGSQAVDRALAILDCFRKEPESLGITEIARAVGLNISTAHRLVRALCHAGFMEQEPVSERYRLGFAIAVLGQRALEQSGYHLAQPVLSRLASTTGESASLGVRRGDEVMVMERAASAQPLRFDHPTGTEIQLQASAMGKVLLAFSPGTPKDIVAGLPPMTRYTRHTITSRTSLVAALTSIRERGFATNHEERYEGVCGIAAPIIGADGAAHAAVGIQGPSLRLTPARLHDLAPLVLSAADEIGALVLRN